MTNFKQKKLTTKRLTTAYYRAGENNKDKLLLLHGNLSSSVFFLPILDELAQNYDVVIPDLRCFGDSSALPIDARRGYRDWSEDVKEFIDSLNWDKFSILGWSMGGGVGMQYTIDYFSSLIALILVNPCSPYGFGGSIGTNGQILYPKGRASGAGIVPPVFTNSLKNNDRNFLRYLLNETICFSPGFKLPPNWEQAFLEAVAKTKVGQKMYPGDFKPAFLWPFVSAGDYGVCNAMSSKYGNLTSITDIEKKPPILWIRGENDNMISDHSICDIANLDRLNMFPFLPGEMFVSPQPMVSQTRHVLNEYSKKGGYYTEKVLPGAHCCWMESPDQFVKAIDRFLKNWIKKSKKGDKTHANNRHD